MQGLWIAFLTLMTSLEAICKSVLMRLWSETAHMVGECGNACAAWQDVSSWSEVVTSAPRSLTLPPVHVSYCLRRLWKVKDPNACTLVNVTKGSPAEGMSTGVSMSKGSAPGVDGCNQQGWEWRG